MSLRLNFLSGDEIVPTLPQHYFELQQALNSYKGRDLDAHRAVLKEFAQLIAGRTPMSDWTPAFVSRLVLTGCSFARSAVLQSLTAGDLADETRGELIARAEWLCSVSCATPKVEAKALQQVCGLWAMTHLAGTRVTDPDGFLAEASVVVQPLGNDHEALTRQLQLQVVIAIGKKVSSFEASDPAVARAREWCADLLMRPDLRRLLLDSAVKLQVEVIAPTVVEKAPDVSTDDRRDPPQLEPPHLWPIPTLVGRDAIQTEFQQDLIQLVALSADPKSGLSAKTLEALLKVGPNSKVGDSGWLLYTAARELWKGYWAFGGAHLLSLSERVSLLLLSAESDAENRERANAVHVWMATQLPVLIRTCDVPELLEDATNLCRSLGTQLNPRRLTQGLIEAHAGVCRALAAEGRVDEREEFFSDARETLRRFHQEYTKEGSRRPGSDDEQLAWDFLFPPTASFVGPAEDKTQPTPTQPETPEEVIRDPALQEVIRRGSYDGTLAFVRKHDEALRRRLGQRLDSRLSSEYLMNPEGAVYNAGAQRQLNPRFVDATEALKANDYKRAVALFQRLASQLQGKQRDICRNYEAFALAKDEDLLAARMTLAPLAQSGFPYASAHWNLACCIPAEQMDQRLETLANALQPAPHKRILHGATALALTLDDQRLRTWLLWLPFTEALLLAYALQYEDLDAQARDKALFRLRKYLNDGEPSMPEPTGHIQQAVMTAFVNSMLDRTQEDGIDFWLRCREPVGKGRFDFWQVKGDFLGRTDKRKESLEAFRDELKCRLGLIRKQGGAKANHQVVNAIRQRAEERLLQCMSDQYKDIGRDIWNQIVAGEKEFGAFLLPKTQRYRFDKYYSLGPPPPPPDPKQPTPPNQSFDTILARVGAECHARLHEVSDLPQLRDSINEVVEALNQGKRSGSAEALASVLQEWATYSDKGDRDERQETLQRAQLAFSAFRGRIQTELSTQQRLLAGQFVESLDRVNNRLARTLKLLPSIRVEAPTSAGLVLSRLSNGLAPAFAVRVAADADDVQIRLRSATAIIEGTDHELPVRDRLDEVPSTVGAGESALLTFDIPDGAWLSERCNIRIEVRYSYAGGTFDWSGVLGVRLQDPPVLRAGRYISGRKLEPSEIEGHFFGREREQDLILDSVRDGQQKIRYLEGIRRSGKSSLLSSVVHEIEKKGLPLIPVYWCPAAESVDHVGKVFHDLLMRIVNDPVVAAAAVDSPSEQRCCDNLPGAYSEFEQQLAAKLQSHRVLVLVDDFQTLVETAANARDTNPALRTGILGFLNRLYERANPQARLLWVLAGQRAFRQYRALLGGALLWGTAQPLPIDFLGLDAVERIVRAPLDGTGFFVPDETIRRVHVQTSGHPEVVQQIAEGMVERGLDERRAVLTPADADTAATDVASLGDIFADTWYPLADLTPEQRSFMASLVNAIPVGERILPHLLTADKQLSEAIKNAIDDLAARKILTKSADGTVGVRARVLDMWLHRTLPTLVTEGINGSVAVFIDIANLTGGKGSTVLADLQTEVGEDGVAGRFRLSTVIDCIEDYARTLSPAPIGPKWVINYPKRSPAVTECNAKGYLIENVERDLWEKGDDDRYLLERINDVERGYPNVSHFVLVLGDKGYVPKITTLLRLGKSVHVISPAAAKAGRYESLAREYPQRIDEHRLERLLEERVAHQSK